MSADDMALRRTIQVCADADALASTAAELFVRQAEATVAAHGRFTVALAGGNDAERAVRSARDPLPRLPHHGTRSTSSGGTSVMSHRLTRTATSVQRTTGCSRRCRYSRRTFIASRPNSRTPPPPPLSTSGRCAASSLSTKPSCPGSILCCSAWVWTATRRRCFQAATRCRQTGRLVLAPWVEKLQSYRITLSLPVLNHASLVVFLVSGAEKADVLRATLEGPDRPDPLPAQAVHPSRGHLIWIVDRAAAARLGPSL